MTKRLAIGLAGLVLFAAPTLAQEGAGDAEAGPGRVRFDREQGDPDELKNHVEELLAAVKASDGEKLGELLTPMAPDAEVVEDVFSPEGQSAIGEQLVEAAGRLFDGEPATVAERLDLDPANSHVEVYTATTEDLSSMEFGTVAARHFASGLRAISHYLKEQYAFYSVRMSTPPEAGEEDRPMEEGDVAPGGEYLQLFVYSNGRWVLLGRIWRLG